MPNYSGKFQYLDETGGTINQGPCQLSFDSDTCRHAPGRHPAEFRDLQKRPGDSAAERREYAEYYIGILAFADGVYSITVWLWIDRAPVFRHCRLSGLIRSRRGISGKFVERRVDVEASFACNADHLVGSRRRAAHSQDTIALIEEPDRDWMEDLVEGIVAHSLRSGSMNEGESQPFTDDRYMARTKDWQCK